ncbi:MAG TPA: hypothetical protein ENO14_02920, partial [Chromatiales bacterium]|nr:hypothetical protein [Chromatiales bacterium]
MTSEAGEQPGGDILPDLLQRFDDALAALDAAPEFSKPARLRRVLDSAKRVLLQDGGPAAIEARAQPIETAGTFLGSDWNHPEILVPSLSAHSLGSSDSDTVVIEALSDLRMLAVARGDYQHPHLSAENAHNHLTQVLAVNLQRLFMPPSEAERESQG